MLHFEAPQFSTPSPKFSLAYIKAIIIMFAICPGVVCKLHFWAPSPIETNEFRESHGIIWVQTRRVVSHNITPCPKILLLVASTWSLPLSITKNKENRDLCLMPIALLSHPLWKALSSNWWVISSCWPL